ncbi:MAG TPA: dihydrodipicolinate synthase family protein [Planctomycetota bacterium]|nr:dihydrodipicolinate synthase family protein [Planctomycetota bacterium]
MQIRELPRKIVENVRKGLVIPAQPLALDANRKLDEKRQCAITRYYIDAGAGGIACGVHSTQFEIRDPKIGLFEPVLKLVSQTIDSYAKKQGRDLVKISGVCGKTPQALKEAEFAQEAGYHACLLSLAAMAKEDIPAIVKHCREVSQVMPIVGFYLQPAVGGRVLPYEFWRQFAEIENIIAIKMAPFNRYQTFDVIRAVCEAGRENDITLYTGNDDNIIVDLLTEFKIQTARGAKSIRIKGGLLGHWCVWTKKAVEQLEKVHSITSRNAPIPPEMLTLAAEVTDANAAFFDPAHAFAGCIPGIHEVLRRQGLMQGTWCLNPHEVLSPGQSEEIDRIYKSYPHLNDDEFVKANLSKWMAG